MTKPVIIGNTNPSTDPVLKKYDDAIQARLAKSRADKRPLGNLAHANAAYSPGRDRPMTIAQITESQRLSDTAGSGAPGLKPETIEGLKAIAAASAVARDKKMDSEAKTEKPTEKKPEKAEKAEKAERTPAQAAKEKEATAALDKMDDMDIERIMRSIQSDVINNQPERDHVNDVKNGRITEIDFADGVATGEFQQIVDVIPGKLKVHYRTVTPMETQAIRLWIFNLAITNPTLDKLAGEMYGLGLLVASIRQINAKAEPDHLNREGTGTYTASFNEDTFSKKYDKFSRMPQQLIHAIGTHGQWFDIRVREMFTTDYAKNG